MTLLSDGGVRVTYACGAVEVDEDETAVDLDWLEERVSHHHHHVLRSHLKPRIG